MTVKEVKTRIADLENIYNNMIKIQECCLRNEGAKKCIKELEEKANINTTLRSLASGTACFLSDELHRLEDIINDAVVKIN